MSETPARSGLTPYLNLDGAAAAMDFYAQAFGAREHARNVMGDAGKVIHGHLEINQAPLFVSDFFPENGFPAVPPQGFNLHLQVTDAQTWFNRAVDAGCTVLMPLKLEFWGIPTARSATPSASLGPSGRARSTRGMKCGDRLVGAVAQLRRGHRRKAPASLITCRDRLRYRQ